MIQIYKKELKEEYCIFDHVLTAFLSTTLSVILLVFFQPKIKISNVLQFIKRLKNNPRNLFP
ncbi:hypothetical protein HYN86_05310 [Flavobacterium fluviale]|uniref:Uncharacterized protein n=1 Tax=Flavobacterium fluviale TaxID=2249356 RepID=A0A344LQ57_9FLAO|nr:hypothetical protein HYN86_05310 [Flavobacterium fluviale]